MFDVRLSFSSELYPTKFNLIKKSLSKTLIYGDIPFHRFALAIAISEVFQHSLSSTNCQSIWNNFHPKISIFEEISISQIDLRIEINQNF